MDQRSKPVALHNGRRINHNAPCGRNLLKRDIENIEELRDEDLLREFLHRFGRETNQGEVVFEFDGEFFRIREYD